MKYTNRRGESVEVSDEHIETAIRLKLDLQKMSPSGRTNWAKHKRMMEVDGFSDSDSNESYRQMVKQAQKKSGLLPSVDKYADLVSSSKLQSLEQAVGEMQVSKREAQNAYRELNKLKRDIVDDMEIVKELKRHASEQDYTQNELSVVEITESSDNKMLIVPSDWHIGLSDVWTDYETMKQRLNKYIDGIVRYAELYNITDVFVANLGDIINQIYMHKNTQAFYAEFNVSEQIVRARRLMFDMLMRLSEHVHVTFLGVLIGNHDRLNGNKKESLYHDGVSYIITETLVDMIESVDNRNLEVDLSGYAKDSIRYSINGVDVKMVHGDKEKKNSTTKISDHMSRDSQNIDLLIHGHFHGYAITKENFNRLVMCVGALNGFDNYAVENGWMTGASQEIVIFEDDKFTPISIDLGDVSKDAVI